MTTKDLALNFVSQFNKPFNLGTISSLIDRSPRSVKPVLAELLTAKQIRLVDPEQGIYVRDNRYNPCVCYNQKGDWKFDLGAASALLGHIEQGSFYTIREVAQNFPRSRQWVYVYMEALASIGILGFNADGYSVISRDNLKDIGKVVTKGAICKIYNDYYATSHKTNRAPVVRKVDEDKLRQRQEKREQRLAAEKAKRQALRKEREHQFEQERQKIAASNKEAWERLAIQCEELLAKFKTQ